MTLLGGVGQTGCIHDSDCGICDPQNLILESITAINYASKKVHLLAPPCQGPRCPSPFDRGQYFIEDIGPCELTEEAMASNRGPEEYCKIAPVVSGFGIEFVFNNLLDPTSIELVRRRPDNPQLFEVYDWKTQILEIQGPITRYNGDYHVGTTGEADTVTRLVNLACIENLRARGIDFDHTSYADPRTNPCNAWDADSAAPLKMLREGVLEAARGIRDTRAIGQASSHSCDNPQDGPDTCCNQCDFLLGTQVAKYGLVSAPAGVDTSTLGRDDVAGLLARPGSLSEGHATEPGHRVAAGAIVCDPQGDVFVECAGFVPWTDRRDEVNRYGYTWCPPGGGSCLEEHRLPVYDKLRETHPDMRPPELRRDAGPCISDADCRRDGDALPRLQCVGTDSQGRACSPDKDPDCTGGRCEAPWFVTCAVNADTTGDVGYCIDTRFSDIGAMSCMVSTAAFEVCRPEDGRCAMAPAGSRLSVCDVNEDAGFSAEECCGLGGAQTCDPSHQPNVRPLPRYERSNSLPDPTKDCVCGDLEEACQEYAGVCEGRDGEYAVKFVTRPGGVIYDPAIKGFEWRVADTGAVPRAAIEACAEQRQLVRPRTVLDGWRAHDAFGFQAENYEDYDRAMCSGQTYRVVFNTPEDGNVEHVRDKVGNALEGKAEYVFETPQFQVVPRSGFPTDNLRIGACDDFSIRFSNKYDLSPENLEKLQIYLVQDGVLRSVDPACDLQTPSGRVPRPVAGGPGCARTDEERKDEGGCRQPCLTVDVGGHGLGEVAVSIDATEFSAVLQANRTYRLVVPALASLDEAADPERYRAAFWDACGMPLISLPGDYVYEFTIDEPKCKEDLDGDGIPGACDNADTLYNPDQGDIDRDGVGDIVDLCPTVVTPALNTADSDSDGIGNECDNCRRTPTQYNQRAAAAGVPTYLQVRNVPSQKDSDGDGIGDVCDNCVVVANCADYGPSNPWRPGAPIPYDDPISCQRDDGDMIGDACAGMMVDGAAGPVGFLDDDDFDQDGLRNFVDGCPRQPVERIECEQDADCGEGRTCERPDPMLLGVCNHYDRDGDGVGDECDTCPAVPNPLQVVEGAMQLDDQDGDFVGKDCEADSACEKIKNPRPFSFHRVSSLGLCCTTAITQLPGGGLVSTLTGEPIVDPDGLLVTLDCVEDADGDGAPDGLCRRLPGDIRTIPGMLELPAGCDEALAEAGLAGPEENPRLGLNDVDGDLDRLWDFLCLLPQHDQDFDGVGDACDLCPYAFDPENVPYIDANNKVWPKAGKYCNGDYSPDNTCAMEVVETETDLGTDSEASDGGGSSGSTGI